ncbi:SDR family NAD(P)-dependent oxidoreductase [Ferrimonas marina]|uniref:Short-chain dehydrogenase n=1 Tax=Ferrimonas marina TaxID=299255 RepID=A0A1M5VD78_9GAMM|nr:SDR family NAD(P)-dependent oxidoreductase [Ferrimonas marina]SHH73175.1 Short-chain dehydrogenase [Ferrimonas marina]
MAKSSPVALVTGASRGIGREICLQLAERGIQVWCAARQVAAAQATAEAIEAQGGRARAVSLEVRSSSQVDTLLAQIESEGGLDLLINNAGVYLDATLSLPELDDLTLHQTLETNLYGPIYLCRAALPGMMQRCFGRIVNVSSGYGALADMGPKITAYRISKAGLNALTAVLAAEVVEQDIKVNSVCPGWVRTDMGGPEADRSPQQAAADIVWAATLPSDGPSGQFLRDRRAIPW